MLANYIPTSIASSMAIGMASTEAISMASIEDISIATSNSNSPPKSQNFANSMASTSSNATSVVTNVEMP